VNDMAKRKYQTECAVHMFAPDPAVVQPDDFQRSWFASHATQNPCHVYMICSRPRIAFDLPSFTFHDGLMSGRLSVQLPDGNAEVWFQTPTKHADPSRLRSPYPHTQLHFLDTNSAMATGVKAQAFLQMLALGKQLRDQEDAAHLHLKVLYVGQAYGNDGSRQATDRLMAHETLQKVYAEIIASEPHKEVWLALLCFREPMLLMSIEGRNDVDFLASAEEEEAHLVKVSESGVSWHQKINFAEASLIRYFKPPYNTMFKETFPSPVHKTYSECYDLDLNSVSIELQTDRTLLHLFSDHMPPQSVHLQTYPLHSRSLRRSMFDDVFDE
jgi:hypothetical protein